MRRMGLVWLVLASAAGAQELTLERALQLALERNERAQAALSQGQAADGRLAQARAFFFPSLTVNASGIRRAYEVTREVGGTPVVFQQAWAANGNAQLRWTLFDARSIPTCRAATADNRATRLEAAEARRVLVFETAEAFLQTLATEQVEAAARRRAELAKKNVSDTRARKDAGLVSANDVTRTELEAATAERERISAEGQARIARKNLAFLLDVPEAELGTLGAPTQLFDAATSQEARVSAELLEAAAAARPDVAALQERATQAALLAQEPLLRLVPTLGLFGQLRLNTETGFQGRPWDGFASLDFTWVLFDGGARYGAHDERQALARIAALNARLRERRVAVEVENALVSLGAARAAVAQAAVGQQFAGRNAEETNELYRQGLSTALQLADATVRTFEADVAVVRERYNLALSLLELRNALGVDPLGKVVTP